MYLGRIVNEILFLREGEEKEKREGEKEENKSNNETHRLSFDLFNRMIRDLINMGYFFFFFWNERFEGEKDFALCVFLHSLIFAG